MENLSQAKILKYDTMLEELTLMSFSNFPLSTDQLYYYHSGSKRLGHLKHTYLKLEPISWHYESHEGDKWTIETLYNQPKTLPKALAFVRFKIIGVYYSLDKLLSKSKLKGFSRVIDDNDYFSEIPLINQLTHFDNGILYSSAYMIETSYDQERQAYPVHFTDHVKMLDLQKNWDKFDLDILVNELENPIVKMTGGKGHIDL